MKTYKTKLEMILSSNLSDSYCHLEKYIITKIESKNTNGSKENIIEPLSFLN